jgi:SWI/SNF-related matrix-associated actin-dependent regulator of chromatin subfamily A3
MCWMNVHFPRWNPAVEDQAMDRIYRIGQKKSVYVTRLVIAGSVEERVLALQDKKKKIISGVLGNGKSRDEQREERVKDLMQLFGNSNSHGRASAEDYQVEGMFGN